MKKFILLFSALLMIVVTSFAQTELTGALGLTFGMNKDSVISVMQTKGVTPYETKDNLLSFKDVPIGTKTADRVYCYLVTDPTKTSNKILHTMKVVFVSDLEAHTQSLYDEIKSILETKYGKADKSYRTFQSPYTDGDGYEMQAVRVGKASISSYWNFKYENTVSIELNASGSLYYIAIFYQDATLYKEVKKEQENKNKNSF